MFLRSGRPCRLTEGLKPAPRRTGPRMSNFVAAQATAPSTSQRPVTLRAGLVDRDQPLLWGVVDLQRRVLDLEALVEHPLELAPHLMAVVAGADEHVRRKRGEPGTDLPDVQVVHVGHARVGR